MDRKAYLHLQNGAVFEGRRVGAEGEAVGEVVFTTGMTGYLETLADPGYYGQIVVQTFPLIGNCGMIPEDVEGQTPQLRAYIVRECCQTPSNFRCQGTLEHYLAKHHIVALEGVDTRALTRMVREAGVMNGLVSDSATLTETQRQRLEGYRVQNAVKAVSGHGRQSLPAEGKERCHVALWDLGASGRTAQSLQRRGCRVTVFPAASTAEEILSAKPDGVMLTNGPGDPAENGEIIDQLRALNEAGLPTFGVCLGHQLLALSRGAETEKMKYGHHGANQPAKDAETGRVYITGQNHGYVVKSDSVRLPDRVRFFNVNDGTCEGIEYGGWPAFSVQFHPESSGGPLDTAFLFDRFVGMMEGGRGNAAE